MGAKELNAAQQELFEAVRKGDVDKVHSWLSNKRNKRPRTPLNFLRPTTPQTAWLCSMVDPSNGYTVLHLAALQGHAEVIKILLDVDSNMLNAKDRRGCLPVHLAAWNGHVEAVQVSGTHYATNSLLGGHMSQPTFFNSIFPIKGDNLGSMSSNDSKAVLNFQSPS
uniref:Uncharacterized protein n=1 Tax=Parascaris equorum TaxID=6256 RepID=A0A914SC92_PAREQ